MAVTEEAKESSTTENYENLAAFLPIDAGNNTLQ